jgi:hypothetical protein
MASHSRRVSDLCTRHQTQLPKKYDRGTFENLCARKELSLPYRSSDLYRLLSDLELYRKAWNLQTIYGIPPIPSRHSLPSGSSQDINIK